MTLSSNAPAAGPGLFGIPLGRMGWFASLLIGTACGFMAFFASTFCAIVTILFLNAALHTHIDYAVSYRRVGLPVGAIVLVSALAYLGLLWWRRILGRN